MATQFHHALSQVPETTGTISLGSESLRWLEAFLNNLNVSVRATVPTPVNASDAATKAYVDAFLTVENGSQSVQIIGPTRLRFDQNDGFLLTNPSSGVARLDLSAIPNAVLANSSVTINTPAAGISGGGAVALGASLTLSLANDLSAVEGIGTTGMAVRSAADTWLTRAIAGTSGEIDVADGDGVAGAPTISLSLSTVTQAAAEAGTETTRRVWTAQRVNQAIVALAAPIGATYITQTASTPLTAEQALNSLTADRLLRNTTGGVLANSLLSDNGTNVTLTSGRVLAPDGTGAAPSLSFTNAAAGLFMIDTNFMGVRGPGGTPFAVTSTRVAFDSTSAIAWVPEGDMTISPDLSLFRGGADILEHRRGTNSQELRLENTFTDASNREFASIGFKNNANVLTIETEAAGTGTVRSLAVMGGSLGIGTTSPQARSHVGGTNARYAFDEVTTDPSTSELSSLARAAVYMKSDKFVIAYNNAGTITYITIAMDGLATTWVHGTTAP